MQFLSNAQNNKRESRAIKQHGYWLGFIKLVLCHFKQTTDFDGCVCYCVCARRRLSLSAWCMLCWFCSPSGLSAEVLPSSLHIWEKTTGLSYRSRRMVRRVCFVEISVVCVQWKKGEPPDLDALHPVPTPSTRCGIIPEILNHIE